MATIAGNVSIVASSKPPGQPTDPQKNEIDDKALRRRQQYKFHQRRHRAKQKEKMIKLGYDVQSLLTQIEQLNQKCQRLHVERNCFNSRGTDAGVPARLSIEYFRLFEYGFSLANMVQQEQFLRSIMTEQTVGPDYTGVETVIMYWKRFKEFYTYSRYEVLSMNISALADSTVVVIDTNFHISCRRDVVLTLYPSLCDYMELLQRIIGSMLVVPVQYRFEFDHNGMVTWFSADWDLISALTDHVSLMDAANILADANISKTGQIHEATPRACMVQDDAGNSSEHEIVDPRHSVDFLLS